MSEETTIPRYRINSYLDWIKAEGVPDRRGLRHRSFLGGDAALAALRHEGRRLPSQGARRFRQHVPVRARARRLLDAAAPPLRVGHLRPRRHRQHADRIPRRHQAQLRMGRAQHVRDPAQCPVSPLQRQRPEARADRRHHQHAAGDEPVPQRELHLRHRRGVCRPHRQGRILFRRGRSRHDPARQPYVGDQFRPRSRTVSSCSPGKTAAPAARTSCSSSPTARMHAHISEMPPGTYKKAHRHGPGAHVMCVVGTGFSLLWFEGQKDFLRIDWKHGMVFPPADRQLHQHFNTSNRPARYLATGVGGIRYPLTAAAAARRRRRGRQEASGVRSASRKAATRSNTRTRTRASIRCGSTRWRSNGGQPKMDKYFPDRRRQVRGGGIGRRRSQGEDTEDAVTAG